MEDYIEMIYRNNNNITVKELANNLNVKASSVSKMANRLKKLDLIIFEKYSKIYLTKKGIKLGKCLLWRHNVLTNFFKKLNKSEYNLEQVEKIEHFIDLKTIININNLIKKTNL